jgi:hypothetical protein
LSAKTFQLSHLYPNAGTFTVTVGVSDGEASSQATATVVVLDPLTGVGTLTDRVGQLGGLGNGEIAALKATLNAASNQIRRGNGSAAANQLGAFVHQLEAFVAAERLRAEDAGPLIDYARRIAASVSH